MRIYEDGLGSVELIDHMGNDLTIVNAARVSYGKHKEEFDENDAKLIKYMLDNKHSSVFEHCIMTFRFKVPLFVRSQHHRHRTWSFNEISRRYTGENLQFYVPRDDWRVQASSSKQASESGSFTDKELDDFVTTCVKHCENSLTLYNDFVDSGVAREQARMLLPQNLYTEYYGTIDLKNAIDFLRLRMHKHAQFEIRAVANAMYDFMLELYPETMKFFTPPE